MKTIEKIWTRSIFYAWDRIDKPISRRIYNQIKEPVENQVRGLLLSLRVYGKN